MEASHSSWLTLSRNENFSILIFCTKATHCNSLRPTWKLLNEFCCGGNFPSHIRSCREEKDFFQMKLWEGPVCSDMHWEVGGPINCSNPINNPYNIAPPLWSLDTTSKLCKNQGKSKKWSTLQNSKLCAFPRIKIISICLQITFTFPDVLTLSIARPIGNEVFLLCEVNWAARKAWVGQIR